MPQRLIYHPEVPPSTKNFLDQDFLLQTDAARELYYEHAAKMPIIDYHYHLDSRQIAESHQFEDLTEIWLDGDHYEWRVMRVNGIPKECITRDKPSYEELLRQVETMPYAMRSPPHHQTHLEFSCILGIHEVLNPASAEEIYATCMDKLRTPEYRTQTIVKRMDVETVCITDDPIDSLGLHQKIRSDGCHTRIYPVWRPSKVLATDNFKTSNDYLSKLEAATDKTTLTYKHLLEALQKRHDFFATQGCRLPGHGLNTFYAESYTEQEIEAIFLKARMGRSLMEREAHEYRLALLYELAAMDARSGWVQRFHIGVNRDNNKRMLELLGSDTGFDTIDDRSITAPMNHFFSHLDQEGLLAKMIAYNLSPCDTEPVVTNVYNFSDSSVPGKTQCETAWWFLDQIKGMEDQLNTLSSLGLLSRLVGMPADSRSLLSYPRHEYFRRTLCNMLGNEIEESLLPISELSFIGQMVEDVSYNSVERYFGF